MSTPDADALVDHDRRVHQLLADAEAACGPVAWPRVEALVGALVELYGVGLERIVALGREAASDPARLDASLAADEVVASLLLVHDLHPVPLDRRLEHALDRVRSEVPHAGRLEVVDTNGGVAVLRPSDPAASVPTTAAVARAIEREAPELDGIRIDAGIRAPATDLVSADRLVRGARR